jgi:hypothetical membrane protein
MLRKVLLVCGILSSLLYVGTDVLGAMRYKGYSYTSQAISELMAIGAPTKPLVDPLFITYSVLVMAFGVGVWGSARRKRALRFTGGLLVGVGAVGLVATLFFPMHQRGAEKMLVDTLHVALTGVITLFILLAIGFRATVHGRQFRLYSFATLLTLLVFGALAALDGIRLAAQQPTPWLGVTERITIGAYLLWVLVLAIAILRKVSRPQNTFGGRSDSG